MYTIIGIDPGYKNTGYGILNINNNKLSYVSSGLIKSNSKNNFLILKNIYTKINNIINLTKPNYSVIEKIFIGKNMNSSIKLCSAKTSIILALLNNNIPIFEYTSTQVKKYTLGGVYSNKNYTKIFIKNMLDISIVNISSDEADALAIAITHLNFIKINKVI